ADVRFGSTAGIGLFRASAASLLNPGICAAGTHLQSQAANCWMQTPPVLVNPVASPFYLQQFGLAVDERATGTGAGDVYLAVNGYRGTQNPNAVFVVACSNATLQCSAPAMIDELNDSGFPYVQVRPDGVITVSYIGSST